MSVERCYGEKEGLVKACANLGEQERMLYKGSVACGACMAQLEKLAEEDPLTNLPNERAARKQFEELRRSEKPFGVIFMDLVNFKHVNESRSHRFGDNMLRVVAKNIDARPRRREEDEDRLTIRKGGDEFIALVALDRRSDETLSDNIRLETVRARYISDLSEEPLVLAYNQLVTDNKQLSLRAGAALYEPVRSFDELLEAADPKGALGAVETSF